MGSFAWRTVAQFPSGEYHGLMRVLQLAFACHVYAGMTGYDVAYLKLQAAVSSPPNLASAQERAALIKWLNSWGCRQFAKAYHDDASREIGRWFADNSSLLVKPSQDLADLNDQELEQTEKAFVRLSELFASERSNGEKKRIRVSIGPTGAAKILFALRPRSYPPWDIPIRQELQGQGIPVSYKSYLVEAIKELAELRVDCARLNLNLQALPSRLGRPESTLAKIVDEYKWVTVSKNCHSPSVERFQEWARWQ